MEKDADSDLVASLVKEPLAVGSDVVDKLHESDSDALAVYCDVWESDDDPSSEKVGDVLADSVHWRHRS